MGANRTQKQFRSGMGVGTFAKLGKVFSGVGGVLGVFVLVHFIPTPILAGIMDNAGGDDIVLIVISHIGIRGHLQQFFSEHYNRFGMTNQTAIALGEDGVILAGRGSTNLPKVFGGMLIQIFADLVAQDRTFNERQFTLKVFGFHHSLFSFVRATALLITYI